MELKYIVYITINKCNGKFYFGVHKTNPEVFDGYIGDGIYCQKDASRNYPFHNAVKKYGYNNFKRTTIAVFPDTEDGMEAAYKMETEIVNPVLLRSKECYNLSEGGRGGRVKGFKRVYKYSLDGEFLRSFDCISNAAKSLDVCTDLYTAIKSIRNNCLGTTKSAYGYF